MKEDIREPEPETPIGSMRTYLRDQFAAAALQGLLASGADFDLARRAYQYADKMLLMRDMDPAVRDTKGPLF